MVTWSWNHYVEFHCLHQKELQVQLSWLNEYSRCVTNLRTVHHDSRLNWISSQVVEKIQFHFETNWMRIHLKVEMGDFH